MLIKNLENILKFGTKKGIIHWKEKITFGEVAEEWLEYKKNMVKESTYYNYLFCLKKYLYPKFKNTEISKIRNYNNFIEELSKDLSPKTVRDIATKMKSILNYYEEEYDKSLRIKKVSLPKLEKNKIKILTSREKEKIETYCLKEKSMKSLGIIICLNTGLRVGELCALQWRDIELDEKMIYVRKTLQRVYEKDTGKSKIVIDKPKSTSSTRTIPINKSLYEILKPLKKNKNENSFVLTGSNKEFLEPRNYQYYFRKILKKCKIKKYKFHILRHTFATNCIEVGMDIKSLSEVLGHSDVNVTLSVYVHSSDKIKKKYLEKLCNHEYGKKQKK